MATQPEHIYLNTASCGLIAPESLAAGHKVYEGFASAASATSEQWRMQDEPRIRQTIADFIGVDVQHVAMVPNFSWAINAVVQSLKGTERVLLYKGDYPSFLEPFRINKFAITWIDAPDGFNLDMDAVRAAIISKTVDIVALSHVMWSTGYKTDLQELSTLCKAHGVVLIVDATQSLGANVIDLRSLHIDVFAASSYKWMNAGFATGILYLSDGFLAKYQPVVGGHNSYKMVGDEWKYVPSVLSYEPGGPNMFGLAVLEAAINHKNALGMAHIAQHNMQLTELLLQQLKELPAIQLIGGHSAAHRSPIVYLKDKNGLGGHIKQHNITVTQRNGLLRVSMHFYNTAADVLALAACLRKFLK